MFDDVCMACGKQLDDSSLYCNNICATADVASAYTNRNTEHRSPSPSQTSSVFNSPGLMPTSPNTPFEVPPLVLPKKRTSSSSASSAMTSEFEEDDHITSLPPLLEIKSEHVYRLPPLGNCYDAESTPITISAKMPPMAAAPRRTPISALPLNFARRPAPADIRSMIPPVHVRSETKMSNTKSASHLKHRHTRSHDLKILPLTPHLQAHSKRNRASLPAYFSRLSMGTHGSLSPPGISHVDVHMDTSVDVLATPKASSRHVNAPVKVSPSVPSPRKIGYPLPVVEERTTRREAWIGRDVSPQRSAVPMAIQGSSMSRERSRGRERGRDRGRIELERELEKQRGAGEMVEGERRGRSRITTRLRS
ncbi:hypothetical protein M422DRAFT_261945 [Sphaerobolus stellatus SS14]|uniref:Uncharacterized protein n=1 Tax=Sphaerobolus stellatus (strain SS14) TaxID=990650 RepID=A0A0C9ULK3_SPHS4|nr:hypothetical protein M422DRAFT_261945 [Sphaerobolus stellatus SS14]